MSGRDTGRLGRLESPSGGKTEKSAKILEISFLEKAEGGKFFARRKQLLA
jgi:hypothetical protein